MKKLLFTLTTVLLCFGALAANYSITLGWDPNSEASLIGYNLYVGTNSGAYTQIHPTGTNTTYVPSETNTLCTLVVSNLQVGVRYYFAVTATNNAGVESAFSSEINYEWSDSHMSAPAGFRLLSTDTQ